MSKSSRTGPGGAVPVLSFLLAIVIAVCIQAQHAGAYFFLFDDYALIDQASTFGAWDILRQPLFGFYRPAVFLLTRAEILVMGGWHPLAFAALSLVGHALNSALAGLLAARLRVSRTFALATAAAFFLSPWAGEAFFWGSARFDLLATTGVLLALWLGELASDERCARATRMTCVAGAALATALALLSKESSVVTPALFVGMALMSGDVDWRARVRTRLVLLAASAIVVLAYVLIRQRLLPGLAGVYGQFGDLLRQSDVVRHIAEYVVALVLVPMPADWSWSSVLLALIAKGPFLAVSLPALLVLAWRGGRRPFVACVGGFLIALAPVSWIGMTPMHTSSGRLLYLPGLFFAFVVARGMHEAWALAPSLTVAGRRALWGAVVAVPLLYFAGSLHHQQRMWARASDLARSAVEQFAPLVGTEQPVFLTNLPFWFVEGPYVLKSYAFSTYYAPRPVPPLRVLVSVLSFDPDGGHRVREVSRIEQPGGVVVAPREGERVFSFQLPVTPAPGAATP